LPAKQERLPRSEKEQELRLRQVSLGLGTFAEQSRHLLKRIEHDFERSPETYPHSAEIYDISEDESASPPMEPPDDPAAAALAAALAATSAAARCVTDAARAVAARARAHADALARGARPRRILCPDDGGHLRQLSGVVVAGAPPPDAQPMARIEPFPIFYARALPAIPPPDSEARADAEVHRVLSSFRHAGPHRRRAAATAGGGTDRASSSLAVLVRAAERPGRPGPPSRLCWHGDTALLHRMESRRADSEPARDSADSLSSPGFGFRSHLPGLQPGPELGGASAPGARAAAGAVSPPPARRPHGPASAAHTGMRDDATGLVSI
jgi:hypothetical protein